MGIGSDVDTIVIGAGQAGLAVSYCLEQQGVTHRVLERGRAGHTWRTQRWDSFHLNTPNVVNLLPGDSFEGDAPLGFAPHADLVAYFERYHRRHALPIEESVSVTAVRPVEGGYDVEANGVQRRCRNVVLCSGDQNVPVIPRAARSFPEDVLQLHAADYRRPDALPDGAVLVVGSGQSGVQIVEDLLEAGRTVYVATSAVGRCPRRYRGKDIFEWIQLSGMADQRPEDLEPADRNARQPQVSGTRGGHTVSLQQLARDGATLLGRFSGVRGRTLHVDGTLESNAERGDAVSARLRATVDGLIQKTGVDAPPPEPDPAEAPFSELSDMARIREVDMEAAGVRAVIWATGFRPGFDYLDPALRDGAGRPRHVGGIGEVPGLYCVGLLWLRRRVSGLIAGVGQDAAHVAEHIRSRSPG